LFMYLTNMDDEVPNQDTSFKDGLFFRSVQMVV